MPKSTPPKSTPRFRKTLALVAAATAAPLALAGCAVNTQTPGAAAGADPRHQHKDRVQSLCQAMPPAAR